MVHNHREREAPPRNRGRIPVLVRPTTSSRTGLRSGGPPPEPTAEAEPVVEAEPPRRTTIRIPPRVGNREVPPAVPTASAVEIPETAPPRYERVAPELVPIPRSEDELSTLDAQQEQPREDRVEETQEAPQQAPTTQEEEGEPSRPETRHEETAVASRTDRQTTRRGNPDPGPREETQRAEITLDPETAETIWQIAQEQREMRVEVRDMRQELFKIRVTVKTHDVRLDQVFKRVGDCIADQWGLRAAVEEIRKLQVTAGARPPTRAPAQTLVKTEPVPPTTNTGPEGAPAPRTSMVSDIESLYASEEESHTERGVPRTRNRGQGNVAGRPEASNQHQDVVETPGEAWIRRRNEHRFGLGTEEALERWHAASIASRERRVTRQQGVPEPPQQRGRETRDRGGDQAREQRRSVTQPHEVGFGQRPSRPTPSGSNRPVSERGRQLSRGSDPGSSDSSRRGGGGPDRRSRRGSNHTGDRSRTGSQTSSRPTGSGRVSGQRRGRSSPPSSSPSSSNGWDSDFTVLGDEDRRRRERRNRRRDPKAEYEEEQLRKIRQQ